MDDLSHVLKILQDLKPELIDKYHVRSIGLFGSIVRDDYASESDVDIIVDFSKPVGIEFLDLADFIEDRIGKLNDLVSKNGVKDRYFNEIASEILYVQTAFSRFCSAYENKYRLHSNVKRHPGQSRMPFYIAYRCIPNALSVAITFSGSSV